MFFFFLLFMTPAFRGRGGSDGCLFIQLFVIITNKGLLFSSRVLCETFLQCRSWSFHGHYVLSKCAKRTRVYAPRAQVHAHAPDEHMCKGHCHTIDVPCTARTIPLEYHQWNCVGVLYAARPLCTLQERERTMGALWEMSCTYARVVLKWRFSTAGRTRFSPP